MAEVKNYGLSGVHRTLQLGKQGPVLVGNADTDSFSVTLQDGATLTNMGGANATSGTHFITKSQLDSVYTEAQFLANVNYNDTSPILLGNISSGTKTIITTFTVSTAFDANAVVTIGDSSNNSLLMSDNYCEIEATGIYQTINTVEFASNTSLNIYVTQGGASAGVGNVLVSVVDGPVVNAGAINYGAGGGSNANIGDFVFSNTEMTTTGNDIYIKSPDDLFLDALGDDVIIRADDDIRFRPGYDFDTDTYTWELRYTDGGSAIFYNSTSGNDFGYIRPVDNAGSLGMSYEGVNDAYVKSNNGNNTWKFASNGDLTLPSGGDIKDSTGVSVLGAGGISLSNISVTSNSPSGNGSLTYSNTTGVFTFTPADASLSNYGNSNVVTLLSSFGSNTLVTTGNISGGNVISSGKFVGDGSALTNVTVSVAGNITGTSQNVSLVAGSFTATFDNTGILTLPRMGGDEGGEINFGVPATNTTLSTRVVLDVYQDRLRIFDGNTKGAYIDLSQAATGVGTLLNNRVSGLVNAGTFVTMDLIKATVTTSGNRGLSLATTTGSFAYNIGGTYGTATPASGGSAGNGTLTTTATASIFNWGFTNQGDTATYILTDTTNSRAYRITLQIGNAFNNNMISIERLI